MNNNNDVNNKNIINMKEIDAEAARILEEKRKIKSKIIKEYNFLKKSIEDYAETMSLPILKIGNIMAFIVAIGIFIYSISFYGFIPSESLPLLFGALYFLFAIVGFIFITAMVYHDYDHSKAKKLDELKKTLVELKEIV